MGAQSPNHAGTQTGAIFLSYASQDAEAAQRICAALRLAGIEVWFDQSELRGGDAWDASIRRQIKECALFLPVISAHTDARPVGYFRREWHLAVDRMMDYAEDQPFLLPVVIDGTVEATARVPDRFRERQWMYLKDGAATPEWVEHTKRLLTEPAAPARRAAVQRIRRRRNWPTVLATLAGVALVTVAVTTLWRRHSTVTPVAIPKAVTAAAPAHDRKAIAVLPFDNLSGHAEDAYLADGLQAEVLNRLARLRELSVISRTSTLEYRGKAYNVRDIGNRLGVGSILEGSIRREGGKLRLSVHLVDTNSDRQLLAANYDRDLGHLLDLQNTVARQVADSLLATVSLSRCDRGELERVGTDNGDAYDLYLRAMAQVVRPAVSLTVEEAREAKRQLQAAIKLDPGYADAYAALSIINTAVYFQDHHPQDAVAAKQAFERAFEIAPDLPEARLARGEYATFVELDPERGLNDLESVVQSRPSWAWAHFSLAVTLRRLGRTDEALDHFVRAWDLDPLNEPWSIQPLNTLLGLRRWPEAIEQTTLHLRRLPGEAWYYLWRARIESFAQHNVEPMRVALREHGTATWSRAIYEYEIAIAEGRYLDAVHLWEIGNFEEPPGTTYRYAYAGILYHAAGDESRARQSFLAAERHAQKSSTDVDEIKALAISQSMLGKHAAALATIDALCAQMPESRDAINGPDASWVRSVILFLAGRRDEADAEADRLLHVPFGNPLWKFGESHAVALLVKDDPHFDKLLYHPPRL